MADVRLDVRVGLLDPGGQRLGLGQVGALAVQQGDRLETTGERRERREDRLGPVLVRRDEALVGVEHDRLALAHLADPILASRMAVVTCRVRTSRPCSVMRWTLVATSTLGFTARIASRPSTALRVGTTWTGRVARPTTWRAARTRCDCSAGSRPRAR